MLMRENGSGRRLNSLNTPPDRAHGMHDLGALPSACHCLGTNHYANLAREA